MGGGTESGSRLPVFHPVSGSGATVLPKKCGFLQNHVFLATVSYFSLREITNKRPGPRVEGGQRAGALPLRPHVGSECSPHDPWELGSGLGHPHAPCSSSSSLLALEQGWLTGEAF